MGSVKIVKSYGALDGLENLAVFTPDGAFELYHNDTKVLYSTDTDDVRIDSHLGIGIAPYVDFALYTDGGDIYLEDTTSSTMGLTVRNRGTGDTIFSLLSFNGSTDETVTLDLESDGSGFLSTTSYTLLAWDSTGMTVGAASTYSRSDSHLSTYFNGVSQYAMSFINDGNTASRWGIMIQCGEDDQSQGGTQGTYIQFNDGDGGDEGSIIVDTGTLQIAQLSDRRRKTHIEDVSIDVVGTLNSIRVREYDMLTKSGDVGGHQIGWISQEVKEVYEPMHYYSEVSDMHGIKTAALLPLLHRGWQLHEYEITQLKQKIKVLEEQIDSIS